MNKVFLFLANGFETVEALAPVDVMRRAGLDVVTVSITADRNVVSAQGVTVVADALLGSCDFSQASAFVLPGGGVGTDNLSACEPLHAELKKAAGEGKLVAAICAAPMVLGRIGLLNGLKATCYPGCEDKMGSAKLLPQAAVTDGKIITGTSAGCALSFGLALIAALKGEAEMQRIENQIVIR